MKEKCKIDNLFSQRLLESNIFTEEEIRLICHNKKLYEKCYLIGLTDVDRI